MAPKRNYSRPTTYSKKRTDLLHGVVTKNIQKKKRLNVQNLQSSFDRVANSTNYNIVKTVPLSDLDNSSTQVNHSSSQSSSEISSIQIKDITHFPIIKKKTRVQIITPKEDTRSPYVTRSFLSKLSSSSNNEMGESPCTVGDSMDNTSYDQMFGKVLKQSTVVSSTPLLPIDEENKDKGNKEFTPKRRQINKPRLSRLIQDVTNTTEIENVPFVDLTNVDIQNRLSMRHLDRNQPKAAPTRKSKNSVGDINENLKDKVNLDDLKSVLYVDISNIDIEKYLTKMRLEDLKRKDLITSTAVLNDMKNIPFVDITAVDIEKYLNRMQENSGKYDGKTKYLETWESVVNVKSVSMANNQSNRCHSNESGLQESVTRDSSNRDNISTEIITNSPKPFITLRTRRVYKNTSLNKSSKKKSGGLSQLEYSGNSSSYSTISENSLSVDINNLNLSCTKHTSVMVPNYLEELTAKDNVKELSSELFTSTDYLSAGKNLILETSPSHFTECTNSNKTGDNALQLKDISFIDNSYFNSFYKSDNKKLYSLTKRKRCRNSLFMECTSLRNQCDSLTIANTPVRVTKRRKVRCDELTSDGIETITILDSPELSKKCDVSIIKVNEHPKPCSNACEKEDGSIIVDQASINGKDRQVFSVPQIPTYTCATHEGSTLLPRTPVVEEEKHISVVPQKNINTPERDCMVPSQKSPNKEKEPVFAVPTLPLARNRLKSEENQKEMVLKAGKSWRRSFFEARRTGANLSQTRLPSVNDEDEIQCLNPDTRRFSVRVIPLPTINNDRPSILENYARSCQQSYITDALQQNPLEECFENLSLTRENSSLTLINDPSYLHQVTARDVVLRKCGQTEPLPFEKCYPESSLQHCQKIGEGVYGEVFLYRIPNGGTAVLKVIPIEGDHTVNGESQKKFDEILSEITIAMELSNLRGNTKNSTAAFGELRKVSCLKGTYPLRLLELWELYDEVKGSENDSPEMFDENQLYIILEQANGGKDMESFVFNNAQQSYAAISQVACALAVAESSLEFEHRDLHWGNILVQEVDKRKKVSFRIEKNDISLDSYGVETTIIDFTMSRISNDGVCIFFDLALDADLFAAEGDYQFEIYRLMQEHNHNEWQQFQPFTNILWLHYLLDKAIKALHYKNTKSNVHKKFMKELKHLKDIVLLYKSAAEFVITLT